MQADIEDEYALTAYISLKLDPIVRHDPKKIALYMVTALKKNRDGKDGRALKAFCRRKLDDFVEDKEKLNEFCEELGTAVESKGYLEVRDHPSYATLLDQESGPLTPSNKEYPNVKEDKRYENNHQTRRKRSGSFSDDGEESIEDRPPRGRNTPEKKPAVSSTISVVKDAMAKRLGERPAAPPLGKQICKDFTEKGFCLRGQLCPFDHGSEPVVWQNARPMEVIRYTVPPPRPIHPMGMPQPPRMPRFPPMMPPMMMRQMPPRFPEGPPPGMFQMRPKPPPPPNFRQVVGVPSEEHMLRGGDLGKRDGDMRLVNSMPVKRMAVDGVAASGNCSLEIHSIPLQLNNIAALNSHFFKYGSIVNVQVRYNGSPNSALITFQTPDAASRAFNSSEPVLNNRFIKIDWHNSGAPAPSAPAAPAAPPPEAQKWVAKPVHIVAPTPPVKEIHAPVEQPPPSNSEDAAEVTVTRGFTQGLRVRYPVGARRARAGRYVAGAPTRGHAAAASSSHTTAASLQPAGMSAHHRSIYLSLQASKTESELEKIQSQVASLDESIAKVVALMRNFQQTSEKLKSREMDAAGANKEEATLMLEKMEKQINQLQKEQQRFEEEKAAAVKKQAELEARLSSQKHQIEAQKFANEKDNSADLDESDADQDGAAAIPYEKTTASRSRPVARRASRGRVALLRGTRSGVKRTPTGTTRFRRPTRGAPFNKAMDRRPRRLKLTGLEDADRQLVLGQIQANETIVENVKELDATAIVITFNTRYDAETFMRDLTTASGGRKPTAVWLAENRTASASVSEDHGLDMRSLDIGTDGSSRDAFDSDAEEKNGVVGQPVAGKDGVGSISMDTDKEARDASEQQDDGTR
ncbi:putative RNA-binding protein 26 [Hypsibius exemplaris]|uniref:RNA-binding protein 26 n=1 Tax=Hypsibius exemplaris TaxID=2072580 RepID=A0A1W0WZA4_HYPEX|nr:putative RNA-binding protein 26 [Hypsibius exemplaris]